MSFRSSALGRWGGWLAVGCLLAAVNSGGCASAPAASAVVARPEPPVPLDRRIAWILRLEAQRMLRDPGIVSVEPTTDAAIAPARSADLVGLLRDVDPAVRARAALAIGRVGMAAGVAPLVTSLSDEDAVVRATAAFSLGLIGRPEAGDALRAALADPDPAVRGRAAEGLGLIVVQMAGEEATVFRVPAAAAIADAFAGCGALTSAFAPDDEEFPKSPDVEACRLAIFALTRLKEFEPLARVVLTSEGQPVSAWWPIAYALQRIGDARALPALQALARSPGVYAAAFALRSIAATTDGLALARRFALDRAADERVRVSAIRALGRRGSADGATALLSLITAPGVSSTLELEALNALAKTEDARGFGPMLDRLSDDRPQIRGAAIAGAATIDPDAFLLVVSSLGADPDWSVRAALATTLGTLEADRVRSGLMTLSEDQDQRVRGPALEALAKVGAPDLEARLLSALEAPDYVVRATAARVIGERKMSGGVAALTKSYERGLSDAAFDARAASLAALANIGGAEALSVIRRALSDRDWPVRVKATELLAGAGDREVSPLRPAPLRQAPEFFESAALLHPPFTPVALIETRYGTIEIALNVVEAPLTTLNFMALARAGFFDGLRFHRLVPNFVAQTGDPRGDGEGGPGFAIPDELSPLPYLRGTVGMALSGPDTGGSQFFIAHSPQPHLDGRYTVFGQVVKGMEFVDQLTVHDVMTRVRIWDGIQK